MRRTSTILLTALTAIAVVAVACSSNDSTVDTGGQTNVPTINGGPSSSGELSASISEGWSSTVVGEGTKPVLALDSTGSPAIAYLVEDLGGFVSFASAVGGWSPDRLVEGYFYGPIGLAFDLQDRPNIVYHDHQATGFDQALGDLTHAIRDGDGWVVSAAEDDGHDGWDSTVLVGSDGIVRAAGIDPSQFDRTDGVEYYELRDGVWSVNAIGSGPIAYEFNVSLALSPAGLPALTYYDDRAGDLIFASFDGSSWTLDTVASEGDVGKFSSLAFDAEGRPHISFFDDLGGTSGRILYAVRDGDLWTVEEVGVLDNVRQGMTGTRRNSSLALDAGGVPHVAFSDEGTIRYAIRSDAGWDVQEIASAGERPLGQLVSLALDSTGTPHLAFYEAAGRGLVVYLTRS